MKKRKLPPKPPEPPEGYMLYHQQLVSIVHVERLSQRIIGNHDERPRLARDRANYPEEFRK